MDESATVKYWTVTFEIDHCHAFAILVRDVDTESEAVRQATMKAIDLLTPGKLGRIISIDRPIVPA